MKTNLKKVFRLAVVTTIFLAASMTAFVAESSYSLNITYPFTGSMKSTSLITKEHGESPYVKPSKNTLTTRYFLSPKRISHEMATNVVTTSSTAKKSFTYRSGYGGVGHRYCLSAYPGVMDDYAPYNVSGKWCR